MSDSLVAQQYFRLNIQSTRQDNADPNVKCYMEPIASKASTASRSAVGAPDPKTPEDDVRRVPMVLPRDAEREEVVLKAGEAAFPARERGTDCAGAERNFIRAPDVRER